MSTENYSPISEWKDLIRKEVKNDDTFLKLFEREINEILTPPIFTNAPQTSVFEVKQSGCSVFLSDAYLSSNTILEMVNFAQNFGVKNMYIETENPQHFSEIENKIRFVSKTEDKYIKKIGADFIIDFTHLYTENVHDELALLLRKIKEIYTVAEFTEANNIIIRLPINSNFFFQLAKFRTLRLLILEVFGNDFKYEIHGVSSFYNKTMHDSYNNVLRNTTEALSAMVGGADEIQVLPHDILLKEISVSSLGLALNVHHILAEESLVQHIPDISSKAYYIETICEEIKNKTLSLFHSDKKDEELLSKITTFVSDKPVIGVTKQPNKDENILDILDKDYFEKVISYYGKHRTYNEEINRIG